MISKLITTSILVSNIIFVVIVCIYFLNKDVRLKINNFVRLYILEVMIFLVGSSTIGSLIYSNILNFSPCVLCWYQRILLYPQFVLLFVAIKKGDKGIINYLTPLSLLGLIISLYQWLSNLTGQSLLPCTASGGECSRIYVLDYGYITIPFMALSIFIYILTTTYIYKKSK